MALVIDFKHGDTVSINGEYFSIDHDEPCLTASNGGLC